MATFRVTKATVSFGAQNLDILDDPQLLAKGDVSDLGRRVRELNRDQPVLMTITLGEHYSVRAMENYLEQLTHLPRFRLVAFLDSSKGFIGCASPAGLLSLMQAPSLAQGFLDDVQDANVARVFRYPGMLKNVIRTGATNFQALEDMSRYGLNALAVVDDDRRVKGIVERDQLMSKLIRSLADDATRSRQ